jgi:hypothetical protein
MEQFVENSRTFRGGGLFTARSGIRCKFRRSQWRQELVDTPLHLFQLPAIAPKLSSMNVLPVSGLAGPRLKSCWLAESSTCATQQTQTRLMDDWLQVELGQPHVVFSPHSSN